PGARDASHDAMAVNIFLGYPAAARATAEHIQLPLRSHEHHVFMDRSDLAPGEEYDNAIRDAINHSDLMVFLLSPEAVKAGHYTLTELGIAEERWPHPARRL